MIKSYVILWLFLLTAGLSVAQNCGLEDTLFINPNSSHAFTFDMFDAVNDNLADPNQGICGVELEFTHQFSEDLELWLVSPDNDTVQLIGDNTDDQLAFTFFANWNITFVPCSEIAMPDSSHVGQWNNDQPNNFIPGGIYDGSYYPFDGCLEDFDSGLVNGTWTILVNNNPSLYAGAILNIRLILCDPLGLNCCFADAGNFVDEPDVLACEGSDTLNFSPTPVYEFPTQPDTLEYGYTYAIGQDGVLIAYDSLTDLTGFSAGNYEICGLSYKRVDFDSFPTPDGMLTLDSLRNNLNSDFPAFCGSVSDTCFNVTIVAPPLPTDLTFDICEGDTLFIADTLFTTTGNFSLQLESYAGCDSIVNIGLTVNDVLAVTLDSTICQGDSVIVGTSTYFDSGTYMDSLQSVAGCDSVVTLNLEVLAPVDSTITQTICLGDTVFINNQAFFETGNFEVNLLSSQGCDSTVFLNLDVLDVQAVIAPPDTITCFNNGVTLDGSASSPNGLINFSWIDLSGTVLGTDPTYFLTNGDTIVLVVSQQSAGLTCMSADTVIVIENTTSPVADAGLSDTLNCRDTTLTLGSLNTSQGTEFTYHWTTDTGNFPMDSTDVMVDINAPGNYTLIVTDTLNGCTDTSSVFIDQDIDRPTADAGADQLLTCETPAIQLDGTNSSQGATFTHQWSAFNGTAIIDDNTLMPTVSAPDSFRLLVINEENFCLDSAFVEVVRNDTLPQVIITDPERLNCSVTSLQLDATASDSGLEYNFNWIALDGGIISMDANSLTPTIASTGTYRLIITNTASGCQDSAQVVVLDTLTNIVAQPGIGGTLSCLVDILELDASGSSAGPDLLYCWSTNDGHFVADSTGIQVDVDAPGMYQLIVKDTFTLCADTALVTVQIDTFPPMTEAGSGGIINCFNTQDTLVGNNGAIDSGLTYQWTGPCIATNPDSIEIIVDCPGVYYLMTTDSQTGCIGLDSVTVEESLDIPMADAGSIQTLTCQDTTVQLDGTASTATGTVLYEWSGPGVIDGEFTANPTVNQSGIYNLIVTDSISQCQDTATVEVTTNTNPPMADAGDPITIDCDNPIVTIGGQNTSQGPAFIYEWTTNEGSFVGNTDTSITTVDTTGVYVLFVIDTLNGCRDTAIATVTGNVERPFVNAGPDFELDCGTDTTILNGSASNMGPNLIYQWTGDCLSAPTDTAVVTASCPGEYILTITNTDNGCINQDTVLITLNPQAPVAILADTAFLSCENGTVVLDGSASSPGVIQWLFNGMPTAFNNLTPTVDTEGIYSLIISTLDMSCIDSADIEVILDCTPMVVMAEVDTITCAQEIVTLDASGSTGGQNLVFQWTSDDPNCILGAPDNASVNVNCPGEYTVIITNEVVQLSDTLTVFVPIDTIRPIADAGLPDTLTCIQNQVILDGSGSDSGPDIISTWTNADGDTIGTGLMETVITPGGYFLEVMDTTNGCGTVDLVQIRENRIDPNITFGNFVFPCDRDTFGLDAFITPANADYQYSWTGPGIVADPDSATVQVDTLGTYMLTVINQNNGCFAEDSVTVVDQTCAPCIEVLPPDTLTCVVLSVELTASYCLDCVDCTIQWTDENGLDVPGGTMLSVVVSEPGTYFVTATDTMGFSTILGLEVVQDTLAPIADAGPDRELTCDSLTVNIGGVDTSIGDHFDYQWSAISGSAPVPDDQPVVSVDTEGTFVLIVTNTLTGCFATDTVLVTRDTLAPIADAGADRTLTCATQIVTLNGGNSSINGPYFYQWGNDDGVDIVGENSLNPLVSDAGEYWLLVSDTTNGCEAIDTVVVIQTDSLPFIPPIADTLLSCQDSSIVLEAMITDTMGFNFGWCQLDDMGVPIPASCVDSLTTTASQAGIYVFRIVNNETGCANNETVEVLADFDPPMVNAGLDDILSCSEDSLVLQGTAGPDMANLLYQWTALGGSMISDPNSLTPTIFEADTFVLEVLNVDNQCAISDSVIINLDNNAPTAFAGADSLLTCEHNGLTLAGEGNTASGMISYLWTTDGGQIQSGSTTPNPFINQAGTYILQVTDPVNNCVAFDTLMIEENRDAPEIMAEFPFGEMLTCVRDSLLIDASTSLSNTDSTLTFAWNTNLGNIISPASDSAIWLDSIGIYRLIITDDLNGCKDTMSFQIGANRQRPMLALANPQSLTCRRDSVMLNANGSSSGDNFAIEWLNPEEVILADTSLTPWVNSPGMYTLTVTNRENGCSRIDSVEVGHDTIPPEVIIELPELLDCVVRETQLDGSASSQGGNFTYSWSANPGEIIAGTNTYFPTVSGTGNYVLMITNETNGCTAIDSVEVLESASPIDSVAYTVIPPGCDGELNGEVVIDSVFGGMEPYFFAFNSDFFSDFRRYNNLAPGSYELQIEDTNGCNYSETVEVSLGEELVVDLGLDVEVELGDSIRLEALVSALDYDTLIWGPIEAFSNPSAPVQFVSPLETTVYDVMVRDEFGCIARDKILVSVVKPRVLFIPNVFSPNGDGHNDIFMIFASDEVESIRSFKIFDRWGNQVFGKEAFQPNDPTYGWDGLFNGTPMNPAVFAFFAEVAFIDGRVEMIKGDVTLMR